MARPWAYREIAAPDLLGFLVVELRHLQARSASGMTCPHATKIENIASEFAGRCQEYEAEITTGNHIGHGIRGR